MGFRLKAKHLSKQYDINAMGHITLEEWIENFFAGKYIRVE